MLIDAGASRNVIDRTTWEFCKINKIKCNSVKCEEQLGVYGASKVDVIGKKILLRLN